MSSSHLLRSAPDFLADDDTNTVVVQLAEYGEPRTVNDGRGAYREAIDSMKMSERVHVKDSHAGVIIGHADPSTFREDPNPSIDLTVADTAAGRDLMALVRAGSINDVSIEFNPKTGEVAEIDGVTHRSNTEVHGIAFAMRGAHTAPILATRDTEEQETIMETPDLPTDLVRSDDLTVAVDGLRDELVREISTAVRPDAGDAGAYANLAEFDSFGAFTKAAFRSDELNESFHRALSDQTTDLNPGVIPTGWIKDVKGILAQSRPVVSSFGTSQIPAAGMSVDFPYLDPTLDLATVVGVQSAEKTAITSVVVPILRGSEDIKTFAGGSDVSQQLIERSDPSYLDALMRIYAGAMAIAQDTSAGTYFTAAATAGTAWDPATGTADALRDVLFRASAAVETATGQPASFVAAATDAWIAIGTLGDLNPAPYGVQNVAGTADARSLQVNVSGLPVVHCPNLANGTILVSNSMAGTVQETGTRTISAPNIELLGQDTAIYNMGVELAFIPAGIISIPAV